MGIGWKTLHAGFILAGADKQLMGLRVRQGSRLGHNQHLQCSKVVPEGE
jgi:hypothetical protein